MRCPQCQFENIPGQDRCLRCNAVLQTTGIAVDINPPRMPSWKKPFRDMVRWFRLNSVLPQQYPKWIAFFQVMSGNAFGGLILSIIPGFAHLVGGRFREIIWFFIIWLLTFCAGIYFYGNAVGFALLGIAVGMHSLISFHHALLKEHEEMQKQLIDFLMLLVLVGLFYSVIRIYALNNYVFGYTSLTIKNQNIQTGDLLLGRRNAVKPEQLHRGNLTLVPLRRTGGGDARQFSFIVGHMVGQIIGLPGDTVEIKDGNFIVNNEVLPDEKFPLPRWFRGRKSLIIIVPPDSYFVSSEYNVHGNAAIDEQFVANACVIKLSAIEAKAFILWFPLDRRAFLKEDQ